MHLAGETKIAQFYDPLLGKEQVFGFNISMHDFVLVQEVVRFEDLVSDQFHFFCSQTLRGRYQFLQQRVLHKVKDKVKFSLFAENVPQIDNVVVAKLFKDLNFAHHCFSNVRVLILSLLELLDCNDAPSFLLLSFEHFSISAFANYFKNSILVHRQIGLFFFF